MGRTTHKAALTYPRELLVLVVVIHIEPRLPG